MTADPINPSQATPTITLHLGADHTTVVSAGPGAQTSTLLLALGTTRTAAQFFRHAPPTPLELENAIMAVEDEVIRARSLSFAHAELQTTDAAVRSFAVLAGVQAAEVMLLPLAAVELQFDLLAALVQGRPASIAGIPADVEFAATLLILREFMHHLQFAQISIAQLPPARPQH